MTYSHIGTRLFPADLCNLLTAQNIQFSPSLEQCRRQMDKSDVWNDNDYIIFGINGSRDMQ